MSDDAGDQRYPDPARPEPQADAAAAPRARGFAARLRSDWWWIAILVLCGGFQIVRGAPVDGVLFLIAAVALTADAAGWLARLDRYPLPRVALGLQLALGLIVVVIVAATPRLSAADLVVVALVGLASVVQAWRGGDGFEGRRHDGDRHDGDRHDSDRNAAERAAPLRRAVRNSAVLWSAGGVLLCVWELAAYFLSLPSPLADYEHPPLTDLVEPLLANPAWRAIAVTLWLLAGAALLQRGRRR